MIKLITVSTLLLSASTFAHHSNSINEPQDTFFDNIKALCGKAFQGQVVIDNAKSASFANKKLVMHVRKCDQKQLQVPFHVGSDSSRTWLITKTEQGLSLKHDHRHKDGSDDVLTMYGGHTATHGFNHQQDFPADQYSKDLFVAQKIPQSSSNTWIMKLNGNTFSYRLERPGREFQVDFDLSQPISAPKAPWGYQD